MEINQIIAYNLKRIRKEKRLSLGQLAERADVSKVVLSQIEKGDANPTINTIWKITGALGLPYTSLLDAPEAQVTHIKKADLPDLTEDQYHIFSYYPKNQSRNFELYQIEMEPGCVHPSIGHSSNSAEYIMMMEGRAVIDVNGQSHVLEQDDALFFDGSAPHSYRNETEKTAKLMLLIYYL